MQLALSLSPLALLIGLLALNISLFGDSALAYANQLALLLAAAAAGALGWQRKKSAHTMMQAVSANIVQALPAILILLLIGALAGTWMLSGIVPSMIYYGLQLISPSVFLVSTCALCCVVSLATGTSWGTIATVGVALLGVGDAMGFNSAITAGAIISGAYFGDKMSPLSDTTNLAPAVAGTDLFTHIRYMTITTAPAILLALVGFAVLNFFVAPVPGAVQAQSLTSELANTFNISPWLFLWPLAVGVLIVKKVPAIPALAIGALGALAVAAVAQPALVATLSDTLHHRGFYGLAMQVMGTETSFSLHPQLSELLSTGGMAGMLDTIWLIVCAMVFGGLMESSGALADITNSLMRLARGRVSLVATTGASSLFMNFTASDQYLAIVVPGKMFADAYRSKGLHPVNLSRTLEDVGTVTSVLVPWNTCGAAQATVLGVATGAYWPYCFFCLLSPLSTLTVAALGFKIKALTNDAPPAEFAPEAKV